MTKLETILCVDDDPEVGQALEAALSEAFTVFLAEDCQEALTLIEATKPDLFLVDLVLPEISGPDTLDALQACLGFHETPGILLTANSQFATFSEARPPQLLGVITKPFDPAQLRERVIKLWDTYMT